MNWTDPIVDEVRQIRAANAQRFNNDLAAIVRDLQSRQPMPDHALVDRSVRAAADRTPGPAADSNGLQKP